MHTKEWKVGEPKKFHNQHYIPIEEPLMGVLMTDVCWVMNDEDDARLIAATPKMLRTLECCLSLVQAMALERPDAKWLNEDGWLSSTALCEDVILAIRKAKEPIE